MNPLQEHFRNITRREILGWGGYGLGTAALATLLSDRSAVADSSLNRNALPGLPHFKPRAKRVIMLLQSGAPSHVDLFDHKPLLAKQRGKEIPESVHQGQKLSTMTAGRGKPCLGAIAPFRQHGETGTWISDFLPHTANVVDRLCLVKSVKAEAVNHAPAMTFLLTGAEQPGRPSMGGWLAYGLGSDNDDLPTFCVMTSRDQEGSCGQLFYDFYWGSGFLPTRYQGVKFRGGGDPVLYLSNPKGMSRAVRRNLLDGLQRMNQHRLDAVGDPEIATRISQYEMAFRMQQSVPELTDLSRETKATLDLYGPDVERRGSYAYNCLMARKLAESGVRFVQLMHSGWDQHQNLPTQLIHQCRDTDQPSAGLVQDLANRGLLEDTLVVWAGEFGRTPFGQGDINNPKKHGRDHHPYAYTVWMTGGGVREGLSYGRTDDYGYNVVENPVTVHDLQATILHLLGIDHERLTYKFQGRRFRLTDVHGHAVKDLFTI
ncbi:DUF1501 domain-containing protein [Thalassoroseus pseudoceratinae]|uniref:DUF1501 domain-containing protein n=1 Tax=Thalassoroseus pseudoceratinae TaxID=2713176 RepID=UPI0014230E32|nr:DUF1501 domain-containing protein [Thalassoroseus pseudoceratinae]